MVSFNWNHKYIDFYFEKFNSSKRVALPLDAKDGDGFKQFIVSEKPEFLWFIAAGRDFDQSAAFVPILENEFEPVKIQDFYGSKVIYLKRKDASVR